MKSSRRTCCRSFASRRREFSGEGESAEVGEGLVRRKREFEESVEEEQAKLAFAIFSRLHKKSPSLSRAHELLFPFLADVAGEDHRDLVRVQYKRVGNSITPQHQSLPRPSAAKQKRSARSLPAAGDQQLTSLGSLGSSCSPYLMHQKQI